MDINNILKVASYAGKIMLQSGAEVYRVEETMNRICHSFGIDIVDSFATLTAIIISASYMEESKTLLIRITSRSVDLQKIHLVNDLARNISKNNFTVNDIEKKLKEIEDEKRYDNKTMILFSAIGAFSFVFLFGGQLREAIAAFFIGLIAKCFMIKFERIGINSFFITSISAGFIALLSIISIKLGIALSLDKVITGSVMLLAPGLALTNAIRDTVAGDLVSGLTRGAEAFLTAIAAAVGTGAVLSFWIAGFGGL